MAALLAEPQWMVPDKLAEPIDLGTRSGCLFRVGRAWRAWAEEEWGGARRVKLHASAPQRPCAGYCCHRRRVGGGSAGGRAEEPMSVLGGVWTSGSGARVHHGAWGVG